MGLGSILGHTLASDHGDQHATTTHGAESGVRHQGTATQPRRNRRADRCAAVDRPAAGLATGRNSAVKRRSQPGAAGCDGSAARTDDWTCAGASGAGPSPERRAAESWHDGTVTRHHGISAVESASIDGAFAGAWTVEDIQPDSGVIDGAASGGRAACLSSASGDTASGASSGTVAVVEADQFSASACGARS